MMEDVSAAYKRSDTVEELYEDAYMAPSIYPNWGPDGHNFTYRRRNGQDSFDSIFVDCITGDVRPHGGDVDDENLKPLNSEHPTRETGPSTRITFVNKRGEDVALFWIDMAGNAVEYHGIEAGSSRSRKTYVGHVWRLVGARTKRLIASFEAREHSVATVKEGMEDERDESVVQEIGKQLEPRIATGEERRKNDRVFIRNHDVYFRDDGGMETRISMTGTKEDPFDEEVYFSPHEQFAVAWQFSPEQEHLVYAIESSPSDQIEPRVKSWQYLKPGDKVRVDRPRMYDLNAKEEVPTEDILFENPFMIRDVGWSADGKEYRFLFNQRGHQVLRVIGMSIEGSVRVIVEETSTGFIDYSQKTLSTMVKGGREMIWASERDGWNHLYLIDLQEGKVKNQITKGEWVVRKVDKVDENKRQVWLKAYGLIKGQDPYYSHLARINFDGTGLIILTQGDGTHDWRWSPNGRYLIDSWSRVDHAHQTVLRDGGTGRKITDLENGNVEALVATGWLAPERFSAPGRDGTTPIYGIIVKPSPFDPTKKYPIIEDIYAGPHCFSVPKAFEPMASQHSIAALGFVLVQIDGMGTNWRCKRFHDVCHKNLRDAGFPDRIAWLKAAAEQRPWMDLSRAGIFGSSAGGQNALGALLFHGDVYKAAVADAGCHDNRMDKLWWNEAWMGWPVDESYADSSNVTHAAKLRGKLMLIMGELDRNVDPSTTMQVVDALVKADKDFELVVVPGAGHGPGMGTKYGRRRLNDFFVKNLLGLEPPNRNLASPEIE